MCMNPKSNNKDCMCPLGVNKDIFSHEYVLVYNTYVLITIEINVNCIEYEVGRWDCNFYSTNDLFRAVVVFII